jgi:hypothetical protein
MSKKFQMSELIYKKPRKVNLSQVEPIELNFPSLDEIQKAQQEQLVELARARFGFHQNDINLLFTPLNIDASQSEHQILRLIMQAPPLERSDQILYAIASENINPQIANNILRAIGLLDRLSQVQALENP